MKNPFYTYYCNDCAKEKGFPVTKLKVISKCDYCKSPGDINLKDSRLLTIHVTGTLEKETGDPLTSDYFNTTELSGEELKEKKIKAGTQSDKILKYFRKIKLPMTPSDVHMNLFDESTPLTSVRRAMSNLTNRFGLLQKTEDQKIGIYGSKEYFWELK